MLYRVLDSHGKGNVSEGAKQIVIFEINKNILDIDKEKFITPLMQH